MDHSFVFEVTEHNLINLPEAELSILGYLGSVKCM